MLLETARRESSEAVSLSERLRERNVADCVQIAISRLAWLFRGMRLLDNCGTKQVLSGLLDGSLFNRKPFTRTQIWISTLTSQVMKKRRNLSIRTIPKSLVLLLRPLLILHRLMPEFQGSSLLT